MKFSAGVCELSGKDEERIKGVAVPRLFVEPVNNSV